MVVARFANRTVPPILRLPSRESALAFAAGGVLAGPVVGALIGATTRWAVSEGSWLSYFVGWWVGDALGVLAVGSAIVVLADPALRATLRAPRALTVVLVSSVVAVAVLLAPWLTSYLAIPLLLVLAFYAGTAGVAVGGLVTALVANVTTALGTGAFAQVEGITKQQQLVDTQLLVGAALAAAYLLSTEVAARERADRERLAEREARMRAESMESVGSLSRELVNAESVAGVVDACIRHVDRRLGPRASGINLLGADGRFHELHARGVPDEVRANSLGFTLDSPIPGPVAARTGVPVFVETREELDRAYPALATVADVVGTVSLAAIPLARRLGPAGYLFIVWGEPRTFDQPERAYLAALGDVVGQSIDRVLLREREHRLAVELQHAMLGAPDQVEEVDVATAYRPADGDVEIGGDWYDAVRLTDRATAFVVGDVVGHNLRAAKAMGRIRIAIRTLAPLFPDPAALFERLEPIVEEVDGAAPTTILYAVYDAETHRLRYACAGHPPPLMVPATGDPDFLMDARGLPLGVQRESWNVGEADLGPGDALVLYTDGLIERRDEPLDEGMARLVAVVRATGSTDPTVLRDALLDELDRREDDVAVLVLSPREQAVFTREMPAESSELRGIRVDLQAWLGEHGVTGTVADDIVLATHEAMANAVEHAYRDGPNGRAPVSLSIRREPGGALGIEVRDRGRWRVAGSDPTRGRGLPLISALMDDVALDRGTEGTVVRMRAIPSDPAASRDETGGIASGPAG